ncbi:uncharacterized protein PFL1_00384 [Pseudozyma flocculosa PF-1]|uniref:Related to Acetoacetyl-CoA synthetase n=1 Tax=Pseudozyma flocculosa TaxID=84751 RepID=A0A5C3ERL4_9BASI|nr:uncharacterized protein PFL1_00384 [Pseudozyma flocculosa PF-1]EPQ32187.1 hypothetical protein PFL1_00384 [Pseudozyma flocculosa PF-1]SPO34868.1 related to Acetoacetyl-CoA synthetase [Pseudozyma flocculosa]
MAPHAPQPLVWKPDADELAGSSYEKFRKLVNRKHGLSLETYEQVHAFSIDRLEDFWATVWDFVGIRASRKYDRIISDPKALPGDLPDWFEGARFNLAENLLFPQHPGNNTACSRGAPTSWPDVNKTVIYDVPEGGGLRDSPPHLQARKVSWGELRRRVAVMAETLRRKGVKVGDRLAHVSANSVSPIVTGLAANAVGAIYSLIATDSGPDAIFGRLSQIRPKLILTDDAVIYNGKVVNVADRVADVAERLADEGKLDEPSTFEVVIVRNDRLEDRPRWKSSKIKATDLGDFIRSVGLDEATSSPPHRFEQLPAARPIQIFFSSGTTGEPKCIVHSQNVLLSAKKEAMLHYDLKGNDTFLQVTTCGWIMWIYHYVALSAGASVVTYDGSPLYPDALHIVRLTSELKLAGFGASPRYLSELEKHAKSVDVVPRRDLDLSKLRFMTSTGSPLSVNNVKFFYDNFPARAHLSSISGGTDLAAVICGPSPCLPLYGNLIQCKHLGMDLQIWDAVTGENIEKSGEAGELIIASPFPTQPVGFFGPDDQKEALHQKYMDSYYNRFEGKKVWAQGDFISRDTATGGFEIHGRSDGVLNPSGVRFGSAEIYTVVEKFPFVGDSIVVGQRRPGRDEHERVLLFIKMRDPGTHLTPSQQGEIKQAIKVAYSARHVPAFIFEVRDIPLTLNGKKTELAVKAIVCGDTRFKPSSATANPQSLEEYKQYAEIEEVVRRQGLPTSKL